MFQRMKVAAPGFFEEQKAFNLFFRKPHENENDNNSQMLMESATGCITTVNET